MNPKAKQNKEMFNINSISGQFEKKTVVEDEMENMSRLYTKKEEKMIKEFLKKKKRIKDGK